MNGVKQFCIQLADSVFRKKYRDIENRKFIRLRDSISLNMRLVDAQTEKIYSRAIVGSTVNISSEGRVECCCPRYRGATRNIFRYNRFDAA